MNLVPGVDSIKLFLNKLERFLSKFYLQEQGLAQSFGPKNTLAYFAAASMTETFDTRELTLLVDPHSGKLQPCPQMLD